MNGAAHKFGEPFGDAQTETRPAVFSCARRIRLRELLEQKFDFDARNADPGVADRDFHFGETFVLTQALGGDQHLAFVSELDRVSDEVGDDLTDPLCVAGKMLRCSGWVSQN